MVRIEVILGLFLASKAGRLNSRRYTNAPPAASTALCFCFFPRFRSPFILKTLLNAPL